MIKKGQKYICDLPLDAKDIIIMIRNIEKVVIKTWRQVISSKSFTTRLKDKGK